jgi:uncharacterized membrane protein
LYSHEKKLILPLVVASVLLFLLGMSFAYFLVFPVAFHFFSMMTPSGVSMMTDIDKYLSFVMGMFIAFGVTFEVPIIVIVLVRMGVVSVAKLREGRPYVIVGAFVVAAVVTPPDVLSQTMLAVPLWLLYEVGIIMAVFMSRPARAAERWKSGKMNRKLFHYGAAASLVALILLTLAWELWLAPVRPGGSFLALKAVILLAPLMGILKERLYTYQWSSMFILAFFTEGIMRSWGTAACRRRWRCGSGNQRAVLWLRAGLCPHFQA